MEDTEKEYCRCGLVWPSGQGREGAAKYDGGDLDGCGKS